jgi:hypothetical protein
MYLVTPPFFDTIVVSSELTTVGGSGADTGSADRGGVPPGTVAPQPGNAAPASETTASLDAPPEGSAGGCELSPVYGVSGAPLGGLSAALTLIVACALAITRRRTSARVNTRRIGATPVFAAGRPRMTETAGAPARLCHRTS